MPLFFVLHVCLYSVGERWPVSIRANLVFCPFHPCKQTRTVFISAHLMICNSLAVWHRLSPVIHVWLNEYYRHILICFRIFYVIFNNSMYHYRSMNGLRKLGRKWEWLTDKFEVRFSQHLTLSQNTQVKFSSKLEIYCPIVSKYPTDIRKIITHFLIQNSKTHLF